MATLSDKYVNSLIAKADDMINQRKASVQKQYNAWAAKQKSAEVAEMQPVSMDTSVADMQAATPDTALQSVAQKIPVLTATAHSATAPYADDKAAEKAEKARKVENFANTIQSIKNEQNKAKNGPDTPDTVTTSPKELTYSALNKQPVSASLVHSGSPALALAQATTAYEGNLNKTGSLDDRFDYYASKWLSPNYKMTDDDKKQYQQLINEWKEKKGADWEHMYDTAKALGSAGTDYFADYPELAKILDIDNKLDLTYQTSMGGRAATGGLNALSGWVASLLGVPEENIKSYEEKMALDAANARTQNKAAYDASRAITQMAKDYALIEAAKGMNIPVVGKLLNQGSVVDAWRAGNSFLGKVGGVAKTAGKNTVFGMPFDIVSDTAPEAIYNAYLGKSGEEVAAAAAENVASNLLGNLFGELTLQPGLQLLTEGVAKRAGKAVAENVAEEVSEKAAKEALQEVQPKQTMDDLSPLEATKEAPTTKTSEELEDIFDDVKANNDVDVKPDVETTVKQDIPEEIKESGVSVFRDNPVTGERNVFGSATSRRLNEIANPPKEIIDAVNADPALKEATGNAWAKYIEEFEKADAGQANTLRAATNDLAEALEAAESASGVSIKARQNLDNIYNILMHSELPDKFNGTLSEVKNPLLDMIDEQGLSNIRNSTETVKQSIEDALYRNMKAIQENETLKAKVQDVTDAYDKWVDAVYAGIGDTERLGKDVRNAMGRAERAFSNEGLSGFHVSKKMAEQIGLADIILKQNTPEGYVQPSYGYHAGDLGKAESLGIQTGRDTGHYGTGTYFAGNRNIVEDYHGRPIEAIDFSNYNTYRPSDYEQGKNLHEYLAGVNNYYDMPDDAIKTTAEWDNFRQQVADTTYTDPVKMYNDLKRLYDDETIKRYVYDYGDKLIDGKPVEWPTHNDEGKTWLDLMTEEEDAEFSRLVNELNERELDKFAKRMEKKYETTSSFDDEFDKIKAADPRYIMQSDGTWFDDFEKIELSPDEFARKADLNRVKNALLSDITSPTERRKYYLRWGDEAEENAKKLFGLSDEEARKMISEIRDEIKEFNGDKYTADSASTRFMKRLGYEGVDVRGIEGLDNTRYGSVIYDLKGKDLEQQAAAKARRQAQLQAEKSAREMPERIDDEARMTIDPTKNTVEPTKSVTEPVQPVNPDQPNLKTRKTYSNTMQNSDIFPEKELAENPHYAKEEFGYLEQPESESLEKASDILASNKEGQKRRFASEVLTPETAKRVEASDIDSIYMMIRENNEAIENAIDAAEIARLRRENGIMTQNLARINTNAGQVVQANAKWSRTPEGMRIQADAFKKGKVDEILKEADWGGDVTRLEDNIVKRIDELIDSKMWDDLKASDGIDSEKGLNLIRDELAREINNAAAKAKKNISGTDIDNLAKKIQQKLLSSLDIDKIEDQLMSDDIWQMVAGVGDITEEHMDVALKLLDEAKQFNPNSKDAAQRIDAAYLILANDIGHGKSLMDKLDAWRYFAMLSKPTTHLRNMLGNTTFGLVTGAENSLSAVLEAGLDRASKVARHGKGIDRTKSLLGPQDADLISACARDFTDNAYGLYKGNKYYEDLAAGIEKMVKTFDNKGAGKAANFLTETNTALLDAEDVIFGQSKYATSLAGYLKANGYGIDALKSEDPAVKRVVEDARAYALSKANEATFHNNSAFAKLTTEIDHGLREWSRLDWGNGNSVKKAVGLAGRHIVPFAKTPANILSAILSRGPQESVKVLYDLVQLAKHNPNVKAKDLIEDISKTASGTMILGLGAYLYSTGHIELGGETDNERFNKKSRGITGPSLKFGNTYVALNDGNVPTAILAMGANLAQAYKGKKGGLDAFLDGLASVSDTVVDTTMLSGIADVINSARYSKDNADLASRIGMQVITNAAGQYIPNLTRGFENVVDSEKRNTSYTGQTGVMDTVGKSLQYASTGIPFLQEGARAAKDSGIPILEDIGNAVALNPQVDRWGNDIEKVGGDALGRLANNTINPTSITTDQSNALDKEIDRLYARLTDDTNGEPIMSVDEAKKLFTYTPNAESKFDGEPLSRDDWYKYQQERGKSRYDLMNAVVNSRYYKYLTDEEKATMLKEMDDISKNYTREKYGAEIKNKKMAKLVDAYKEGGAKAVLDIKGENIDTTRTPEARMKEDQKAQAEEQKFEAASDDIMGTLQKAGVVDKYAESVPKEAREAYAEYGMQGVEDYATVKSNKKGASYEKYSSLKSEIPTLTAKEYTDIYNNYSVPNKKGEYDNYFTKDTELIPYLTSRAWDNDEQLNIYAHALSPSVEGTWHIVNGKLYYNKPSVERWRDNGKEYSAEAQASVNNMVSLFKK